MAVWSPVKASFWKSPVSQRLFSRHLPEEGAWPAALTVSAPLQQRAVWSVLKGGLNSRNMKTWHLRLTPRQWWDGSLVDRARCQASLCGPWTLPLNRGQQHRWHPGETHHLLLKHRIIKVGHTGMLPSLQVCVCVCRPGVLIFYAPVFPLVSSGQQPERSPEIHPSDRDDQHQQPIFSLDHVHGGSCARQRHHCSVRLYKKGKGK